LAENLVDEYLRAYESLLFLEDILPRPAGSVKMWFIRRLLSMISWISFCYRKENWMTIFTDVSNDHADIDFKNTTDVRL
jgi:hypothetical protein